MIRSVRRSLLRHALLTLVRVLVVSKVELSVGWSSSHTAAKVAVSTERHSSVGVLSKEVRTHIRSPP